MNYWRNVVVERAGDRWRASSEYVCAAEGGEVYHFHSTFDTKEKAEFFVSAIRCL